MRLARGTLLHLLRLLNLHRDAGAVSRVAAGALVNADVALGSIVMAAGLAPGLLKYLVAHRAVAVSKDEMVQKAWLGRCSGLRLSSSA